MIQQVKSYYLKGILAIYIIALTSLYYQVQSLFGDNGVVPLKDFVAKQTKAGNPTNIYNIILSAPKIGLNHATLVELLCLLGVALAFSALFVRRLINALTFASLWYIYYSISSLGQGFMSFHSDLLLLEVGFITILLAPLLPSKYVSQSDHDHLTFFLLRWVVFRYFVSNILNIYLEGDNSWYQLTAFPMVAHGVPFPSLFSYHIFNMPSEYLKVYQAYEHTTLLCTPFLFLFDLKYCRLMAFYTLLIISLVTALVINFGWTDLIIIVCLFSFLKDSYYSKSKKATKQSRLKTFIDVVVLSIYVGTVGFILVKGFGLKFDKGVLKAQVLFTPAQFKLIVDHLVPISFVLGILGLLLSAYSSIVRPSRKTSIFKTILYAIVVGLIFFSSFPTLSRFAPGLETKVKTLAYTKDLSRAVAPLNLSNNYLLTSKISQNYADGRPELHIQGRGSPDDPTWQQYDLRYKLGNINKPLARVVPHIPRIDLKMWYAARSSIESNQWLQTFAYRLATNEKDIVRAVTESDNVYKAKQIRIVTLNHKYSNSKQNPSGYWLPTSFQSEYLAPTTIENLKFVVKSNGISLTPSSKTTSAGAKVRSFDQILSKYLDIAGDYIRSVQPTAIIWTLAAISAVSIFT